MDDSELISQYQNQASRACLNELVNRHLPRVRSLILPMVGQSWLADDLTQETFFRAMRSLQTFQGKSQFGTWLSQIAINVVREYYRKQQRQVVTGNELELTISAACHPDRKVQSDEALDKIQTELLQLPEAWREAVSLVCIQGYSVGQAAKICGCTLATLHWRLHQSRKRLKQRLADYL